MKNKVIPELCSTCVMTGSKSSSKCGYFGKPLIELLGGSTCYAFEKRTNAAIKRKIATILTKVCNINKQLLKTELEEANARQIYDDLKECLERIENACNSLDEKFKLSHTTDPYSGR